MMVADSIILKVTVALPAGDVGGGDRNPAESKICVFRSRAGTFDFE